MAIKIRHSLPSGTVELLVAAVIFVALLWQSPQLAGQFSGEHPWSAAGLYAGIFSWTSIQSGLLFGIYTFVLPRSEPFLKAISKSKHFIAFKRYMLATIYFTLFVASVAFALTVVNPQPKGEGPLAIFLALWLAAFAWSFLAFIKIIRSFRKLDRTRG